MDNDGRGATSSDPSTPDASLPAGSHAEGRLVGLLAVAFSVFAISEVNFPHLPPFQRSAIFLAFPLVLTFLMPKRGQPAHKGWIRIGNYVLAALSVTACGYIVYEYDGLIQRMGTPTPTDLVAGAGGMVLVVLATVRLVGWSLPMIAATFVVYAYLGGALPTVLGGHNGYSIDRIITQSFLTTEGVFGIPLDVMFRYVFPFVLFGIVLEAVGGLGFAIDLAEAVLGRFRGGPSKVAVVSSAVFGMVNGSAVANVVTAGSFTIPMMKKTGVQAHVAGAIEAVASTGGQLMPPVMGAAAFMMAEFLGVAYLEIVVAALIPALLYYLALFTTIHFYSVRHHIGGIAIEGQGALILSILRRKELYLFAIPVGVLIGFLASGFTPTRSVSWAMVGAFGVSMFAPQHRLTPRRLHAVLEKAGKDSVSLCAAVACVGIVIGLILMTALGSRFTPMIVELSAGNTYIALALVMFSSVVLGMGLPTMICYVLLATLAAPALVNMGILPLAAHMFILYFGMMSMVTPPSALAAYAGAMIAGSDIMKTGFTAWLFSLSGYLLPFMFALNPALLMVGSVPAIVAATATGALGVMALGAAVAGHVRRNLAPWERALLFAAAAVLIHSGLTTDAIGLVLVGVVLARQYGRR
jgi:TRAP transporter 4TM/12TM fusion protein